MSAKQLAALEINAPDFEFNILTLLHPNKELFTWTRTRVFITGDNNRLWRLSYGGHGGIGALAFGIGTSEVEHVLATQTLLLKRPNRWK